MFTRIVKMHFKPEDVDYFIRHFDSVKEKIRNQPGCRSVILYQDKANPDIFFTYSIWKSESNLKTYRESLFFRKVWKHTKQLFLKQAEAWSVDEIVQL